MGFIIFYFLCWIVGIVLCKEVLGMGDVLFFVVLGGWVGVLLLFNVALIVLCCGLIYVVIIKRGLIILFFGLCLSLGGIVIFYL